MALTSSADTKAGGALCAALPIPMMKRPRQLAVSAALRKSNRCVARGVRGSVFSPIQIASTPNGRLIAKRPGPRAQRQDTGGDGRPEGERGSDHQRVITEA